MKRNSRAKPALKRLLLLLVFFVALALLVSAGARMLYPKKYAAQVTLYADQYRVPRALVYSVIKNESSFRPDAVSSIGARGLMQITEETFDWAKWRMGDETTVYADLFEPETNIKYGVFILSMLLDEFKTQENALAAYHAGWGSVKKWLSDDKLSSDGENIDKIPFGDTARYVPKVIKTRDIYKKLYKDNL